MWQTGVQVQILGTLPLYTELGLLPSHGTNMGSNPLTGRQAKSQHS
jgi:hypothetical protein